MWITEGSRKADAAVCAGIACMHCPGFGRRTTNGYGGKVALADWHDIALNDQPAVLAFDSDVIGCFSAVRKPLIQRAR